VKRITRLGALCGVALVSTAIAGGAEDANVAEAKGIVKRFAETLQGELQTAMKEGGPVKAIEICQQRAPAIAQALSEETGWDVGRTSLKVRNAARNAPDDWERQVLVRFDERQAAGEDVQPMAFSEVVEADGQKTFRFMKAIPAGDVCMACHGTAITPEVAAALDAAYPDDQARGYTPGQVRGAFTLSKPL
jgi:hypothetical protein